ncbi:hypothetical protein BJ508DRAFT_125040 [Ascobolus immersus RN42]|uniref:Uncharacterized protein n=1 Tax=Ascobolus immersus RN42 TaxID=1160509 RepID=A0A3N4I7V6_ASCIM|nr:hypothetical protein BJ508DRAFT_125040 [Ascobolus immersus RN42]
MSSHPESDLMHESTYEMLSDSMILSDDEDQSSVASLDDHSGEDEFSVGDSDDLVEFDDSDSSSPHEGAGIPSFGGLDEHEHTLTNIDELRQGHGSYDLVFDEPTADAQTSVSKVIREISNQNHVTNVVTALHLRTEGQELPESLRITAKQTMGPETLKVDGPFRLMIVGSSMPMESIIEKIGGALAVTALDSSTSSIDDEQRASRFNIVPVSSFCTDNSPEVELIESFGLEMEVDVCSTATCIKGERNTETYSLTMVSNKTVVYKFEAGQPPIVEPRSYKLPHFAVVYCSESDDAAIKQTRLHARSFLRKHEVPMVVITDSTSIDKALTEVHQIDHRTLHLCIESGDTQARPTVHKRLPVDLKTFASLDVRQMNRNLAVLTGLYEKQEPTDRESESMEPSTIFEKKADMEKGIWSLWFDRLSNLEIGGFFGVLGWLLAFTVFVTAIIGNSYLKAPQERAVASVSTSQNSIPSIFSPAPKKAVTPSSKSSINFPNDISSVLTGSGSTSTSTSSAASCSAKPEWNTLLLDAAGLSGNESQDFKLHIIGEQHILLRPPHKFSVMKKTPQFIIDVNRNEQFISSEVSKLFDGVYAIQIPKEDAWGVMNVTVSTKSKPIIKEVFELDFGTPWLKVTHWKDLASHAKLSMADTVRKYQHAAVGGSEYVKQAVIGKAKAAQNIQLPAIHIPPVVDKVTVNKAQGNAAKIWSGIRGKFTNIGSRSQDEQQ